MIFTPNKYKLTFPELVGFEHPLIEILWIRVKVFAILAGVIGNVIFRECVNKLPCPDNVS